MKRYLALLLVLFALTASAIELEGYTVEGNYWFGEAVESLKITDGITGGVHQSFNLTGSARLSPGFVVGVDYTYSSVSNPNAVFPDVKFSNSRQLWLLSVGYPHQPLPGLNLTFSAGVGALTDLFKASDAGDSSSFYSESIKTGITPQLNLAAQYKITPVLSICGGYQMHLTEKGNFAQEWQDDCETVEIKIRPTRWHLEGKYLVKPGGEAVLGYRANIIPFKHPFANELEYSTKGIYLGARFSY